MMRMKSIGAAWFVWVAVAAVPAQAPPADAGIDAARDGVGKWIATQRLIFQEGRDWQQQKEVLHSRIDLMRKEVADLDAKIAETRRVAAEADGKKSEARATKQKLTDQSSHLDDVLAELESGVRRIERLLPPPVQEKVQPLFQRIPADPTNTKTSIAERFQNVLGIMNEVNKASTDITLATEVRTLADGRPSEVKTLYVGLAQAYYLSPKGEAGVGRPTLTGWVWTQANDLAPRILHAVEILEGKTQAKFVPLPVKIS